jgi:calcineurin-like phosphoesterase family protein
MKIPNIWLTSDWHLGHFNILKFKDEDGNLLRPGFEDLWQMYAAFREGWHECVKEGDKVYHLGDLAMGKVGREQMLMMNGWPGKKRLIRGNHDLMNDKVYHDAGFKQIYGVRQINGVWLTHVPMHPQSLVGRARGNVHGHLHANYVLGTDYYDQCHKNRDPSYFNVCPEAIGYKPIHIEEIIESTGWDTEGMIE